MAEIDQNEDLVMACVTDIRFDSLLILKLSKIVTGKQLTLTETVRSRRRSLCSTRSKVASFRKCSKTDFDQNLFKLRSCCLDSQPLVPGQDGAE